MPIYGLPGMGVVGTTVLPNFKCEGCLHFERQAGPTGLCSISLQPATCGKGDHPTMGYYPIVGGASGTIPRQDVEKVHGSPRHVGNDGKQLVDTSVFTPLGDEHVELLKSVVDGFVEEARTQCPVHLQKSPGHGTRSFVQQLSCACPVVDQGRVVKAFWGQLQNRERGWGYDAVAAFVAKAWPRVYEPPINRAALGHFQEVDPDLAHEEVVEKSISDLEAFLAEPGEEALAKAGEGSRGGVIVGRTRSGKPVYARKDDDKDKDREKYSKEDHEDAAKVHQQRYKDEKEKHDREKMSGESKKKQSKHEEHFDLWKWHEKLAQRKGPVVSSASPEKLDKAVGEPKRTVSAKIMTARNEARARLGAPHLDPHNLDHKCPTCVRSAPSPYREHDEHGKVTHGCVDAFHTGHLVSTSESNRFHNRKESEDIRRRELHDIAGRK